MHDEPVVGVHEAQVIGLRTGRVADDARDEIVFDRDIIRGQALALCFFRQRLEMRLDGSDLG